MIHFESREWFKDTQPMRFPSLVRHKRISAVSSPLSWVSWLGYRVDSKQRHLLSHRCCSSMKYLGAYRLCLRLHPRCSYHGSIGVRFVLVLHTDRPKRRAAVPQTFLLVVTTNSHIPSIQHYQHRLLQHQLYCCRNWNAHKSGLTLRYTSPFSWL